MKKSEETGFGPRLRAIRIEKRLSLDGLAIRAGMSKMGIYKLEKGHRTPSWKTVLDLAKALGVTCQDFAVLPAEE